MFISIALVGPKKCCSEEGWPQNKFPKNKILPW